MQKMFGFTALAIMAGSAQAIPMETVTMTFTGDNVMISQYNYRDPYISGSANSGGVPNDGTATDWRQISTTTVALAPGNYYAHFAVQDEAASAGDVAGFIATILPGAGRSLIQSDGSWEVCVQSYAPTFGPANGCNSAASDWISASVYGDYGVAPWNTNVSGGQAAFGGGAQWIWSSDNKAHNYVVFRTAFEVIPEPSIIALFGLGLLGLGFAGRRKAHS